MSRTYETVIRVGAEIAKALKGDSYAAAMGLTKLSGAAKQLKSAEKAAASYKALTATVAGTKAKYDQASEALRRLEEAERAAGGATKESTQWRKAGERQLARYARELDRANKAAEKGAQAMRNLPLARFEAARERLFGARKEDNTPLIQKAGAQFRGIASDVLKLAGTATAAGAAVTGLVLKTLKAGDEIGDTADKIGIGAEALQQLRYGAKQSGAEAESLDRGLKKMLVTVGKFKTAKGKGGGGAGVTLGGLQMLSTGGAEGAGAKDPFKQIGLSAKALSKLAPEEQFKKIAGGMAKLKTQADKAAVAQAIFGKGSVELLPFLKEGPDGIDKLARAANKYGGVLSKQMIDAADEADKAMKDAEMAFGGVTATLGGALLPVATKVFREFSQWVASNRDQIQKWAQNAAVWIETKAIPAIKSIVAAAQSFGEKIMWLVNTFGASNLAIGALVLRLTPLGFTLGKIGFQTLKFASAFMQLSKVAGSANALSALTGISPALLSVGATLGAVALAAGSVVLAIYRIVSAVKELGGLGRVWQDMKDFVSGTDPAVSKGNKGFAAYEEERKRLVAAAHAQNQSMPMARTGGGGGPINYSPVINLQSGSRQDMEKQLDDGHEQTKRKFFDELDRKNANQQRVSFGF